MGLLQLGVSDAQRIETLLRPRPSARPSFLPARKPRQSPRPARRKPPRLPASTHPSKQIPTRRRRSRGCPGPAIHFARASPLPIFCRQVALPLMHHAHVGIRRAAQPRHLQRMSAVLPHRAHQKGGAQDVRAPSSSQSFRAALPDQVPSCHEARYCSCSGVSLSS